MEWLCAQSSARRTYRIDGDLRETLHLAHTQFTDPTGKIHYVIMATASYIPWIHGTLTPLGAAKVGYDVLARMPGRPSPRLSAEVPFQIMPGTGRLLAFIEKPVKTVRVQAEPARITAGQPVALTVNTLDDDNRPIPGQFPLDVRVIGADGNEIPALQRTVGLQSGGEISVGFASGRIMTRCSRAQAIHSGRVSLRMRSERSWHVCSSLLFARTRVRARFPMNRGLSGWRLRA
jgi:hypothetical protein